MFFTLCLAIALALFLRTDAGPEISPIEEGATRAEMTRTVEGINRRNSAVKNVFYGSIRSGRSSSTMFYSKPFDFMMSTSFLGRRESEVGSDKEIFWFWIRSFDPKSAYFCLRADVGKTRMRGAIRPDLLKSLLGIDEIDPSRAKMERCGPLLELTFEEFDHTRRLVLDSEKILEQHVSRGGVAVLSARVVDFHSANGTFLPKKIRVEWHEEGFAATLEMEGLETNLEKEPKVGIPPGLGLVDLRGY